MSMMQGMTAISTKPCAFCTLPSARVIDENATTIAVRDGYPVSPGHTLLMPKRHTGSFFDLSGHFKGLESLNGEVQSTSHRSIKVTTESKRQALLLHLDWKSPTIALMQQPVAK